MQLRYGHVGYDVHWHPIEAYASSVSTRRPSRTRLVTDTLLSFSILFAVALFFLGIAIACLLPFSAPELKCRAAEV